MRAPPIELPAAPAEDPPAEWRRLREALAGARREVQRVRARTARQSSQSDAEIFDAHLLLLDDTDLLGEARTRIETGQAAAAAWAATVARAEAELGRLTDPYLRARAADVRAVGDQVLRALLGLTTPVATGRGVLVAADLTPAQAAELDAGQVCALLLAFGSPTAHSAIIARGKGIPAVVGAGPGVLDLPDGTTVAVDGGSGEVVVEPDAATQARFRDRAAALASARAAALAQASAPAVTRDGVEVQVAANLGSLDDARAAAASGADLAGLVRTEFLFLGRTQPPDVEEQEKAYLALADALHGRRLTLRTLDVGGDKPLDYLPMPAEADPFLGLRGLRLSLARPALLADQLLAIVRVAHLTPVSLMFPMVSTVAELLTARRMLDAAVAAEGRGSPPGLEVGIMVEVPATALKTAAFAPHVDFLSIGTNDLTQYALAAARGNEAVADLADPYDPAVLQLIHAVCRRAGAARVAVCGELAADQHAAPLLVGLGVRELSVAPVAVPHIKQAVRDIDAAQAETLAASALVAAGPDQVRALTRPTATP
jgi:phosphocarrier protein FPr